MDGVKRKLTDSLQIRLSLWLSLATLSVALITGMLAFASAFNEVHELQDDVLRQIATLFDRSELNVPPGGIAGRETDSDAESRIFVQTLTTSTIDASPRQPLLPSNLHDGLQTVRTEHGTYRVLVRTLGSGKRLAVYQQTAVRDEIAQDSALRTLIPLLALILILLFLLNNLVRRMFRPVANLAIEISRRGEQDLHPMQPAQLPTEIRPFVIAINRLLERAGQSMEAQRRFIADAAHELRSPLTALSLQAERLADADMSADAHDRLQMLRRGMDRTRALFDQLLTLARVQALAAQPDVSVSVAQVYRGVLEDLMPLAEAKEIDIGVVSDLDIWVRASAFELTSIVRNLVDNAIRYTPARGRIDLSVSVSDAAVTLVVEDSGPGIPEAERERVFDSFYRVLGNNELGSGLGLSIVRIACTRLGASVKLGPADTRSDSGLRVEVSFALPK